MEIASGKENDRSSRNSSSEETESLRKFYSLFDLLKDQEGCLSKTFLVMLGDDESNTREREQGSSFRSSSSNLSSVYVKFKFTTYTRNNMRLIMA